MKSHTTPKRLLKQFSYKHPVEQSDWLWQYSKGKKPNSRKSPTSATRIDGFYADPNDSAIEVEVETQLAQEIEQPVNDFMDEVCDPRFVLTDERKLALTRYIFMLFQRSQARRSGQGPMMAVRAHAFTTFLNSPKQLATVAAHWNMEAMAQGRRFNDGPITPEHVAEGVKRIMRVNDTPDALQRSYVEGIKNQMSHIDPLLLASEWRWLRTTPDDPFMLGDSPVITFARDVDGKLNYGMGFHEPNVEVALPMLPTACLHLLPAVANRRPVQTPTTREINWGQAGYAFEHCFCNAEFAHLDAIMQENGGAFEMGTKTYRLPHENYDNHVCDILMGIRKPQKW
ncbi:MAG: DUF4238 domain-containing protein [Terracidiphilus sp.]|jgi:hypothetical protein